MILNTVFNMNTIQYECVVIEYHINYIRELFKWLTIEIFVLIYSLNTV